MVDVRRSMPGDARGAHREPQGRDQEEDHRGPGWQFGAPRPRHHRHGNGHDGVQCVADHVRGRMPIGHDRLHADPGAEDEEQRDDPPQGHILDHRAAPVCSRRRITRVSRCPGRESSRLTVRSIGSPRLTLAQQHWPRSPSRVETEPWTPRRQRHPGRGRSGGDCWPATRYWPLLLRCTRWWSSPPPSRRLLP